MVGELAMGRFRLLERLGAGGMGTVYRALDERLQREVALKEIDGADAGRVLREAKAAARLNHSGIVTLYEYGQEGRRALLVSELARGEPLDALAADGALSDRAVAQVGAGLCAALAHAHARGVIHRDIKPQNVVVDLDAPSPRAKLMDFGIAAIAGEAPLTAPGEVVGTLAYMSAEQAAGETAGEASDIYSLALTLYECWAGSNPAAGGSPAATARRIGTQLHSLAEARPDLPESLVAAIDDCLEADPALRPELEGLAAALHAATDELDDTRAIPLPASDHGPAPWPRGTGVLALAAIGVLLAAIAGPAHRPGLAVVLAAFMLPAAVFVAHLPRMALPPLAPVFGVASLAAAFPAVAGRAQLATERAILGALGWVWLATASLTLGAGPALPFAGDSTAGWTASASTAASRVLLPLLDPASIGAAGLFALAALAMGPILRAHVSIGLLGALLWGAALDGGLRALDLGAVSPSAVIPAAAAATLVIAGSGASLRRRPRRLRAATAGPAG